MRKLAVIIPAAGSGTRLGSPLPKPFIEIAGKTILEHTIRKFLVVQEVCEVIVATSKSSIEKVNNVFKNCFTEGIRFKVVEGGIERQYSINNALKGVDKEIDTIAVHDAVRPFISVEIIKKAISQLNSFDGAVVGVPAKDTIKQAGDAHEIIQTPDRTKLWQAQTPQVFRKGILIKAYKSADKHNYFGTDDSSLVERVGGKIVMVEGGRENLKITFPIDLKVAEMILSGKV